MFFLHTFITSIFLLSQFVLERIEVLLDNNQTFFALNYFLMKQASAVSNNQPAWSADLASAGVRGRCQCQPVPPRLDPI